MPSDDLGFDAVKEHDVCCDRRAFMLTLLDETIGDALCSKNLIFLELLPHGDFEFEDTIGLGDAT